MAEKRGNIINRLSELTSNQIAAGEVVLRPSSVVKELLENAVDAGASMVILGVRDGGKSLIQVIDDGCGMSYDDAVTAFERHATSKIKDSNDLFNLSTFGFRGEALPSIASVAVVELKTMREGDETGTQVVISGGKLESHSEVQTAVGTNFTVKNLFFNVPARRKFIKSNDTEIRHIIAEFKKVALCYNNISFVMHNNDNCIYSLPATNLRNRVADIINDRVSPRKGRSKLIDINTSTPLVEVKGYVCRPDMAQQNPEQYLFINGRYFKSNRFNKAIMSAYDNLLPSPKHKPIYFLYITCDPAEVDVNVSPSKTEVRFEKEEEIAQIIKASLLGALGKNGIIPMIDFDSVRSIEIPVTTNTGHYTREDNTTVVYDIDNPNFSFEDVISDIDSSDIEEVAISSSFENVPDIDISTSEVVIHSPEDIFLESEIMIDSGDDVIHNLEDYINATMQTDDEEYREEEFIISSSAGFEDSEEVVNKVDETLFASGGLLSIGEATLVDEKYILTTIDSDIYIINLKRAMRRIMYDRYSSQLTGSDGQHSHKLLFPPTLSLQPSDMMLILSGKADLEAIGFSLDINEEERSIELLGIPVDMDSSDPYQLFEDIIDSLRSDDNLGYNSEKRGRLIAAMSQLASNGRYGTLSKKELKDIVETLVKCENYSFSPNGKPIIMTIGLNSIKRVLG